MTRIRYRFWLLVAGFALCAGGTIWSARWYGEASERPDDKLGDGDSDAIAKILTSQQDAWNHGDIDAFLEGYWHSPDVSFSGGSGITRGFAGVRDRYHKNYADRAAMGELDFSQLEFRRLGPNAELVLGHWHLRREKGDVGGVFTLVFQRFPDGWRIVHDHTSAVP
jgi:L-asparaginase / beta-aspartyl-peptidase